MSVLNQAHFKHEAAAFESARCVIWPDGPVCPHCRIREKIYVFKGVRTKKNEKHQEGVEGYGLKKCGKCLKPFTVRIVTIFDAIYLLLHHWRQAFQLLCSSKGISSNQLARVLEIKLQTAWFVGHRIRDAMRSGSLAPMGGPGSIYKIDETFLGQKEGVENKRGYSHKIPALKLIERGSVVRTYQTGKAECSLPLKPTPIKLFDVMPEG